MKELEDTEKPNKSFKVQLRFQLKKYWKYSRKWFPFSIVIGLISGVLMGLFIASIVQLWNLVDKINYYYALFPIVGGITSLLLYFGFKEVKGAGISYVLTHKNTTTPIPSRTILTKFFASLLTLGVNAPAGREGPAVTMGSSVAYSLGDKLRMTKEDQGHAITIGAAMGALYSRLFPTLNPLVVIVIGMSAMHSATTKTPIASMILVLEMVGFPNLIIPMILSNAAAIIISMDFSLYTGQIESKEVILRRRIQYTDILSSLKVREAMETDFPSVKENEKLTDCFSLLYLHKKSALVVLNDDKELIGIISAIDFQQGFTKGHKYVRNVMSKDVIVAYPDDTLSSAFDKLTDNRIECMPVVDVDNPTKMIGFVTFRDIENRYETAMTKLHSQQSLTIKELIDDDI